MSSDMWIDEIVPDHLKDIKPYQPGKPIEELERELGISGAIKIASNENPMGPSPKAVEAARAAVASVNLYPDGGAYALRRALGARLGVADEQLVFGAGCNEIVHMLVAAFCRPGIDEVLTHRYAFISYRLAAAIRNVPFVQAEVGEDLGCDVDALIAKMSDRTRIIFLANPNNPTGAHLGPADLERLLDAAPERALFVVDEAYYEYASAAGLDYPSSLAYHSAERPRLVTLRTFSKIYGLAGLRVGYGVCDPAVANVIERVRRPFNLNSVAQAAALAALDDDEHVRVSAETARAGIEVLSVAVQKIGLRAYPSLGNFVLVNVGRDSNAVYDELLARGVIVRPMAAWGLPECVRISVGTGAEMERVAATLEAVLG